MLAAGLAGIEEGLEPMAPVEDAGLLGSPLSASMADFAVLPANLGEAIERFEASELMKRTFGEHVHSFLVEAKRGEWLDYLGHVSPWEIDRYLAVL